MEGGDSGKLFIGGISWDTNEEQLTEYFGRFGEVAEAVIMRDRVTGRARGFGFVVFADSAVAERVILEKHMIDGRLVEAKKAVPRDDQSGGGGSKSAPSILSSPSPGPSSSARTRKIFVGGLPSSITEPDFKLYFEQFGPISDVVVMYDHTTQRPRGFGFVTFDNDESVDRVLSKSTFHELNGKMVEVKRAVPKEVSPGPGLRSPAPAGGVGGGRVGGNLLNWYSSGGYGMRVDGGGGYGGRYGGILGSVGTGGGRNGVLGFGNGGYGIGDMGVGVGVGMGFGGGAGTGFNGSGGFNRGPTGLYGSSRYGGGIGTGVGYGGLGGDDSRVFMRNNLWGNGIGTGVGVGVGVGTGTVNPNNSYLNMNMNSSSMVRSMGPLGNGGSGGNLNWTGPVGGEMESNNNNNGFGLVGGPSGLYGRNETGNGSFDNGFGARNSNPDLYGGDPIYGDKTWSFNTGELDADSLSYIDNYANNETSRGISS